MTVAVEGVLLSDYYYWLMHGLIESNWLGMVIYTGVATHITVLSVTLYLHRHMAHRSLQLSTALQHFFRFWLWLTTGMITKEWISIHRKHHAKCETKDDPHSPWINGLSNILFLGAEAYRSEAGRDTTISQYSSGAPEDWIERRIYSCYPALGVVLLLVIDLVFFGILGLTVWAVQMLWIPFWAAGVVNGIGHYWGYRNFECSDAATNIFPLGFLIGGEELHNNHHTYPNSAKFSRKPWEFDLGWFWIRLFELLGLAKALSISPIAHQVPGKCVMDKEAAWAIVNDRFRVMARYGKHVVLPLLKEERRAADRKKRWLFVRAKKILCSDDFLLDLRSRERIRELVNVSAKIKTIYELRLSLQRISTNRIDDVDQLLEFLSRWCAEAEETGIEVLEKFVEELRTYSIPTRLNG